MIERRLRAKNGNEFAKWSFLNRWICNVNTVFMAKKHLKYIYIYIAFSEERGMCEDKEKILDTNDERVHT